MKNIKRFIYYIYIILVLNFFIYYLFPSEKISQYISSHLNTLNADIKITIAEIKPAFPLNLNFKTTNIIFKNQIVLGIEQLTITPKLFTLLGPIATFSFQGKAQGGALNGKVDVTRNSLTGQLKVDMNLLKIKMKSNAAIKDRFNFNIVGSMNGNIVFIKSKSRFEALSAKLDIENCAIETLATILNIKSLKFNNIKTEFLANSKKMTIKECLFKGDLGDGSITGSVDLMNPIGKSQINLNGSFFPHDHFFKQIGDGFLTNLISQKKPEDNRLPIHVSGTVDNPIVNLMNL